mgnify:FL=1|tara:strand:- start:1856 stop:2122 length:267 start_codon:yes stop_codon:yes gene_type:complete
MQFTDLKFEPLYDGVQAMVPISDHKMSIVKHKMSYGGKMGLYEIAVIGPNGEQKELDGVTQPGDTVKGFLTQEDLMTTIDTMKGLLNA